MFIYSGKPGIVDLLIKYGAKVNVKDENNDTALMSIKVIFTIVSRINQTNKFEQIFFFFRSSDSSRIVSQKWRRCE